eukprot:COSAG02_NODE_326_length_24603_cov_123.455681_18_plen_60_part_00
MFVWSSTGDFARGRELGSLGLPIVVVAGEQLQKGDQRRITKESDCRQMEGETKGRMLAF